MNLKHSKLLSMHQNTEFSVENQQLLPEITQSMHPHTREAVRNGSSHVQTFSQQNCNPGGFCITYSTSILYKNISTLLAESVTQIQQEREAQHQLVLTAPSDTVLPPIRWLIQNSLSRSSATTKENRVAALMPTSCK